MVHINKNTEANCKFFAIVPGEFFLVNQELYLKISEKVSWCFDRRTMVCFNASNDIRHVNATINVEDLCRRRENSAHTNAIPARRKVTTETHKELSNEELLAKLRNIDPTYYDVK